VSGECRVRFPIIDLTAARSDSIDQAAALLHDAFRGRTHDWQDLDSARREVIESMSEEKISRVALGDSDRVIGWIGAQPSYDGHVWEIHPLVVAAPHRGQGIGRTLVRDLEDIVRQKGGITLWVGTDDENSETSLSGIDLYRDLPGALRTIKGRDPHPYGFYMKLGFTLVGVMPDANGPGKPDIFLAKRV